MSGVQHGSVVTRTCILCLATREYMLQLTCGTPREMKYTLDTRDRVVTYMKDLMFQNIKFSFYVYIYVRLNPSIVQTEPHAYM